MNRKSSTLILVSGLILSFSMIAAATEVHWHSGETPPSFNWQIVPSNPNEVTSINFSGPTFPADVYSNSGCATVACGKPTIIVDQATKTIELWFAPQPPSYCLQYWAPVCGLEGSFGPLSAGDWVFFSNNPKTFFYIPFHVSSNNPVSLTKPNGGEFVLAGSVYTISWADLRSQNGCSGNYLLEYTVNGGQNWLPIDSDAVSNACSYDWNVPVTDSECRVRITDRDNSAVSDTSDNTFYIYQCLNPPLSDLNHDCYVNFCDYAIIADDWLLEGSTGYNDLIELAQHWCECNNPYDLQCAQ